MTSADAALTTRHDACSACGSALDTLGRCPKCGAVFGEAYRCPLCQAISDVEPSNALYYRCRTCGGPRIPPTETPSSDAEVALLRTARNAQLRQTAFRAGAGFALVSGALSLLVIGVVLTVIAAGAFAKVAAVLAGLVPFVLAAFASRRASEYGKQLSQALQQAWLLAATRAVEAQPDLTSKELARALRIDEPRAELLLAEVSVQHFVHSASESAPKLRVTELAEPAEPSAIAEEEASARASASKP